MQFQHTAPWVLGVSPHTGKPKTATSRIVKPGDVEIVGGELPAHSEYFTRDNALYVRGPAELVNTLPITRVDRNGRVLYEVGKDYAVQPGRGIKSAGRILVTALEKIDTRLITLEQVAKEGFSNKWEFLKVWTSMHDPRLRIESLELDGETHWLIGTGVTGGHLWDVNTFAGGCVLKERSIPKYTAWFIRFELLEVYK